MITFDLLLSATAEMSSSTFASFGSKFNSLFKGIN